MIEGLLRHQKIMGRAAALKRDALAVVANRVHETQRLIARAVPDGNLDPPHGIRLTVAPR